MVDPYIEAYMGRLDAEETILDLIEEVLEAEAQRIKADMIGYRFDVNEYEEELYDRF